MKNTEITMAGLLELLSFKTDCTYLSDLHQPDKLPLVRRALRNITPELFSLEEWRDAVAYITGEVHAFKNAGEAEAYLANYKGNQ